jgi:hypothetical protein
MVGQNGTQHLETSQLVVTAQLTLLDENSGGLTEPKKIALMRMKK